MIDYTKFKCGVLTAISSFDFKDYDGIILGTNHIKMSFEDMVNNHPGVFDKTTELKTRKVIEKLQVIIDCIKKIKASGSDSNKELLRIKKLLNNLIIYQSNLLKHWVSKRMDEN